MIPLGRKCDGIIHCADLSDECNRDCGKEMIGVFPLKHTAWTIGLLAVVLNTIILCEHDLSLLNECRSIEAVTDKLLTLLISISDLLMGAYVLSLAAVDNLSLIHI